MDPRLKQRLVGAAVLVALAVIFLPMLVKGPAPDSGVSDLPLRVPDAPTDEFRTVDLPLVTPEDAPDGGVLGSPGPVDGDALPTVDTTMAATDAAQGDDAAAPAPPLPATTAGGDYAVHFAAFATPADAQAVLQELRDAQLGGYAEAFTLNGKPAHRVRLGPYATRAEAETVRLRAAGLRNDVTPRVIALDAGRDTAASSVATTTPPAAKPEPASPPPAVPAPAEPPKPAPVAAANVGFVVQLGAFSKAADATALRDRARAQGIVAFTDTVDTDKGRLTRVKAGPVASRVDAERLKAQAKARIGIDGMIRQHP